jgi:23S rRNA (adenine2030-N6)-methyltransferase
LQYGVPHEYPPARLLSIPRPLPMLSYRHAFHAGNFADVHKHAVLSLLVQGLLHKDAPFCYLDTHAGAGRYDLRCPEAQKNAEYLQGIVRLLQFKDIPAALQPYLTAIRAVNPANDTSSLHYYPGSPHIVRHFLRPQDRMVLTEMHPADAQHLYHEFADDQQVVVHHQDGYQALKAFLPPRERRGLVLMDPAFERREEVTHMIAGLKTAAARWASGLYALWFPITNRAGLSEFYKRLEKTGIRKILVSELCIRPPLTARQLNGSAMIIINPPWKLDAGLRDLSAWLCRALAADGQGSQRVDWLVPE